MSNLNSGSGTADSICKMCHIKINRAKLETQSMCINFVMNRELSSAYCVTVYSYYVQSNQVISLYGQKELKLVWTRGTKSLCEREQIANFERRTTTTNNINTSNVIELGQPLNGEEEQSSKREELREFKVREGEKKALLLDSMKRARDGKLCGASFTISENPISTSFNSLIQRVYILHQIQHSYVNAKAGSLIWPHIKTI